MFMDVQDDIIIRDLTWNKCSSLYVLDFHVLDPIYVFH